MNIRITSRHFKADDSLIEYAKSSVEELEDLYDGIIKIDVILTHEAHKGNQKTAEIILTVYGQKLRVTAINQDFEKSINQALDKLKVRLKKYKERLHTRDRKKVRSIKEKT